MTAQSGAAKRPVALFVMGAQRSGTSALTRVLSLCGGTLPPTLLSADRANPRGYWEPRTAVDLNEAILHRNGSHWADPSLRLQDECVLDAEDTAACIAEIGAFLTGLPTTPLVIIKEPRITLLSGMWFEAARQAGFDITAVIMVRHPQEVVASLGAHGGISSALSSALWLKYNLLADEHTRGVARVFVEYGQLLQDWRREIMRISATLAIDMNTRNADSIEEFLAPDLRRQRHDGPVTDLFGTHWISTVYEALCAAARDEPLDESAMDRTFEAYRASEHDFRTIFEDYRSVQSHSSRRPPVLKLIGNVFAMAHRRARTAGAVSGSVGGRVQADRRGVAGLTSWI